MNLTLRQIRAIAAIRAEGRIAAAARRLGLTPPAVTQQLRQIEDEVGVALFERTARGMQPTAAGSAFADAADAVLSRLGQLEDELARIRDIRQGRLVVGMASSSDRLARRLTDRFAARFPDVAVELFRGGRQKIMDALRDYEVDIVLTARPPRDIPVRAEAFAEYRFALVAPPDHLLAGSPGIRPEALAAEPLLVREPGSSPRIALERFLGSDRARPILTEMPTNDAIRRAVLDGLGIAFLGTHTAAADLQAGRLVVLDVAGTPVRRQWFAVLRSDRATTPIMERFLRFLHEDGAAVLAPEEGLSEADHQGPEG